uniref:NPR1/NIM1-interacting protein 1 n=1 Tax=Rhizophora mucronata TaxID=61149 RepID=A0A2P2PTY3_RHIMU
MENKKAEKSVSNGEEEKRIEEFFSLIRKFHEARNRREREMMEEKEKKKTKIRRLDEGKSSWVPSFTREDFAAEIESRKPPMIFPTGPTCYKKLEEEEKQQVDDDGIDLNLTL